MILLVDANVLLDVLMCRNDFVEYSSVIWKLCETKKVKGYVSVLTIANLIYIMRKELSPEKEELIINQLEQIFEFADLRITDINLASKMKWNDFEDAIQAATAQRIHADYIITRNTKDFLQSKIPALTPKKIVDKIQQSH